MPTLRPNDGWRLFVELAQLSQRRAALHDATQCAQLLAELLAQHGPTRAGRIELITAGRTIAVAVWGEQPRVASPAISLIADGCLLGRLYLSSGRELDSGFTMALVAQLSLLLLLRQRQRVSWIRGRYRTPRQKQRQLLRRMAHQAQAVLQPDNPNTYSAQRMSELASINLLLEQRVRERTAEVERANQQLACEKERLEFVHTMTLELTTQLDLEVILRRALALISTHLAVSQGVILLRDPQYGRLYRRALLSEQGVAYSTNLPAIPAEERWADWIAQHQAPLQVSDLQQDDRWMVAPDPADDVRSVAAVPLHTSDTTLGILLLTSNQVDYFHDTQMNLLSTIARVLVAAVINAQLYTFINDLAGNNAALLAEQREESSKSAAVLSSLSEGVIVFDTRRQITLCNPASVELLDIPSEAILGQPLAVLTSIDDRPERMKRYHTIYAGLIDGLTQIQQSRQIHTTHLELSDPTQVIALNLAPVIGPDGERYGDVAVLRDITREIEADQAKRQFIADVSHELRTPLTVIKGYLDVLLLSRSVSLAEEQLNYLQIIKQHTQRLRSLIEDILEFSRPETSKQLSLEPVAIQPLIQEVVLSLQLEAERKQLRVEVDVPESIPPIMLDQRRISQVMLNLVSNAVKYTFEQGTIQLRAFLNHAQMLQVEIEDNGVGLSSEQCHKLFQPFYRADNPLRERAGGTGLGLAIARQIVEQHGGELWVESEQGRGSIFSFMLPLQQPDRNQT